MQVLTRCVSGDGAVVLRHPQELTSRALDAELAGDGERMLICAEEALRQDEEDPVAAHLRAAALAHLGRVEAAKDAYVLALALAPDDPYVLAGAADLHANQLPSERRHSIAALAWAERAMVVAPKADESLRERLHLLAAWSLSDLGRFSDVLAHADAALLLAPDQRDARIEKGRALFELTRFEEARSVLEPAIRADPGDAEAHHLLGLSLERIPGELQRAEAALARASHLDPEGFPPPAPADEARIERIVAEELAALPYRERRLIRGIPVYVESLPELADLRAEAPPLSPTAVGMFRGPPLGVGDPRDPREILLFARNLRRASRDLHELRDQVRITLLHEIGHLAGEDEADLRARGLE